MDVERTIEGLLRRSGLRRTVVRAGVLEVLAKSPRPLGAVEVLGELPAGTDAVTVYRTLNTLTEKGLLHRVRGEDRVWRYALGSERESQAHRHPHFVCERCGKVECLRDAEVPTGMSRTLGVRGGRGGYAVRYAEVVLHGVCPRCGG